MVRAWASGTFRSLRVYNYRLWAAGSLISNIGTWMQRIAQDWLVLTELTHHSAAQVGIVTGLQFGPQLLFLPWTGSAADNFDQRKLMLVTQSIMGVLAIGLGLLTLDGAIQLWQVYIFAFALGTAGAFDAPARQTFVAEMVGEDDLPNAVALNSMTFNGARMIGPAAAGLLIGSVGTGWAFLLNGLSYFAVVVSLLMLKTKDLHPTQRAPIMRGSFAQGLRYVWGRTDLIAMLVMLFLIGTFGMNFAIYTSTMAVRVFHQGASGYGMLSSMMAIGTITGALIAAGRARSTFAQLIVGTGAFGLGCTFAALAPGYWLYGAALVMIGIASLSFLNSSNSLMQLTTEPTMRGRVMAIRMAIVMGGTPLGAPLVGWVADNFGPRQALGVGAVAGFLAALVGIIYVARADNINRHAQMIPLTPGESLK
jgi:MFS family permease